jgi:nitrite reductase/ring-hydroxylating ferredoxin subunit
MPEQILCNVSDLPAEGQTRRIMHGDVPLCVAKQDGTISVLDDICTHDRATSLADGALCPGCLRCPRHGWVFDLKTGEVPHLPSRSLRVYPVSIDGTEVKLLNFDPAIRGSE